MFDEGVHRALLLVVVVVVVVVVAVVVDGGSASLVLGRGSATTLNASPHGRSRTRACRLRWCCAVQGSALHVLFGLPRRSAGLLSAAPQSRT